MTILNILILVSSLLFGAAISFNDKERDCKQHVLYATAFSISYYCVLLLILKCFYDDTFVWDFFASNSNLIIGYSVLAVWGLCFYLLDKNNIFCVIANGDNNIQINTQHKNIIVWIYAAVLVLVNIIRSFDNCYWCDEIYSVLMSRKSFGQIMIDTGNDVHPPLYYFIIKIGNAIFPDSGVMFHFCSLIPYIILIVISVILINKQYGSIATILFITFCSLQEHSIRFNVEIRMYTWASLFVFLCFLAYVMSVKQAKYKYYVMIGLFGLGAAYTHYYALIGVSFIFISMILYGILLKDRKRIYGSIIASAIAIFGYLYWLMVLVSTFGRTSQDWWMEFYTSYKDCLVYIFQGKYSVVFLLSWIFVSLYLIFIKSGIISKKDNVLVVSTENITDDGKMQIAINLCGLFVLLGTMSTGIWVSNIFRPLFFVKYLYPVTIIAWFLLSVNIRQLRNSKIIYIGLIILALFGGIINYKSAYITDKSVNDRFLKTYSILDDEMQAGTKILSLFYSERARNVYFTDKEILEVDLDMINTLYREKYLLITNDVLDEQVTNILEQEDYSIQCIQDDGYFGEDVKLYSLTKQ